MDEKEAQKIIKGFPFVSDDDLLTARGFLAGLEAERERVKPLLYFVAGLADSACSKYDANCLWCNAGKLMAAYTTPTNEERGTEGV